MIKVSIVCGWVNAQWWEMLGLRSDDTVLTWLSPVHTVYSLAYQLSGTRNFIIWNYGIYIEHSDQGIALSPGSPIFSMIGSLGTKVHLSHLHFKVLVTHRSSWSGGLYSRCPVDSIQATITPLASVDRHRESTTEVATSCYANGNDVLGKESTCSVVVSYVFSLTRWTDIPSSYPTPS